MNLEIFSLILTALSCLLSAITVFKVFSLQKDLRDLKEQRENNLNKAENLDHRSVLMSRLNEIQNKRFSNYF